MSISVLHAAALRYAADGIPVFPVIPGDKRPACEGGFHAATLDVAQINLWWTTWPDANIGMCPETVGWSVVDLDGDEGIAAWRGLEADHGPEPTWAVLTPNDGMHLYFQGSLPSTVRKILPGAPIDTRGAGGYVLLPPSILPTGVYRVASASPVAPLPDWLVTMASAQPGGAPVVVDSTVDLDLPVNLDRARAYLRTTAPAVAGEGGNNRTFAVACEVRALGLSQDAAAEAMATHWNNRCDPPWEDEELAAIIEHAYRYAQNSPALHAATGLPSETFGARALALSPPVKRSRFWPEDEDEQEASPPPEWMIPGYLPDADTFMLAGASGSGKSFLALDIALSIATGRPSVLGPVKRQSKVFVASNEGRLATKTTRRQAWKLAHGVDKVPNFYVMPAPMIALSEEVDEFVAAIKGRLEPGERPGLIVIDTVARAMAGMNENDARDAGQFVRFTDMLAEVFRCPLMVVHHLGKDADRGARGSSSFLAGFSSAAVLTHDKDANAGTLAITKLKDAEEPEVVRLTRARIGKSVVLQTMTEDEYRQATESENIYTAKAVGHALKNLGANGTSEAVTTYVLASALVPRVENEQTEARLKKVTSSARVLTKLAKDDGRLSAYVSREGKEFMWHLTSG